METQTIGTPGHRRQAFRLLAPSLVRIHRRLHLLQPSTVNQYHDTIIPDSHSSSLISEDMSLLGKKWPVPVGTSLLPLEPQLPVSTTIPAQQRANIHSSKANGAILRRRYVRLVHSVKSLSRPFQDLVSFMSADEQRGAFGDWLSIINIGEMTPTSIASRSSRPHQPSPI